MLRRDDESTLVTAARAPAVKAIAIGWLAILALGASTMSGFALEWKHGERAGILSRMPESSVAVESLSIYLQEVLGPRPQVTAAPAALPPEKASCL